MIGAEHRWSMTGTTRRCCALHHALRERACARDNRRLIGRPRHHRMVYDAIQESRRVNTLPRSSPSVRELVADTPRVGTLWRASRQRSASNLASANASMQRPSDRGDQRSTANASLPWGRPGIGRQLCHLRVHGHGPTEPAPGHGAFPASRSCAMMAKMGYRSIPAGAASVARATDSCTPGQHTY